MFVELDTRNLKSTFHQCRASTSAISWNMKFPFEVMRELYLEPIVAVFNEEHLAIAARRRPSYVYVNNLCKVKTIPDRALPAVLRKRRSLDLKKLYNVVLIGLVKIQEGNRKLMRNRSAVLKSMQGDI